MRKLTQSALDRLEAKFRSAGTETMVNGELFVFASSRHLTGTFAKRISDGRIEQISKGRYISSDLTVRKAIQGYFGLPTFRREEQPVVTTRTIETRNPVIIDNPAFKPREEAMPRTRKNIVNALAESFIKHQQEQGKAMEITETYEDENTYEVTIRPARPEGEAEKPATEESDAETPLAREATPKVRKHRENTKQAEILRGLQSEEGITIGKIMAITGWKEPSARGILYRLFKKEMGLELTSRLNEFGERVYRA